MKNSKYIGLVIVLLVFGALFIPKIVDRLRRGEVVDENRHQVGVEQTSEEALLKIGPAPEFSLVNQHGDTVSSTDYLGKVYVVEFFFTSCPTICPVMNANMVKIQNRFMEHEDFGIASITIDPLTDTPERLLDYAGGFGMKHKHWNLLTGNLEDILKLSNNGFNLYAGVNADAEGGFEHSGMFALVDKQGFIRSRTDQFGNPLVYYDGMTDEGLAMLQKDIATLLQ